MEDSEERSEMSKAIIEMVEREGTQVGFDGAECVIWRLGHENCVGCGYELGCAKVTRTMLLMTIPAMYEAKSYTDFAEMIERIRELQQRVIEAKSMKELERIPKL